MDTLKIGLMVPSTNTTMESELPRWLPPGSTCTCIRIPRGTELLTLEGLPDYNAKTLALAKGFADRSIDALAYGCTAGGFMSGPVGERQMALRLAEVAAKPVVTTAQSMVAVLRECNAKNIALVTPYPDSLNKPLIAFLAEAGIGVSSFASFYAKDLQALGRIEADAVDRLARETMTAECDALFIACTQLPTFDIIEGLRRDFERPVWSAIAATAAQVRRVAARENA